MARKPKPLALLLLVLLALALWLFQDAGTAQAPAPTRETAPSGVPGGGEDAIEAAFKARRSKVWVESEGVVSRLLPDDRRPPRHQQFLLRLPSGRTLKVAHNVDQAPKLPLRVGDPLRFRGRYEYDPRGGVLHWTHRDRRHRDRGGWLEHGGRIYR